MGDRLKIDKAYLQRLQEMRLDSVELVLSQHVDDLSGPGQQLAQYSVNGHPQHPALHVKRFRYNGWKSRLNFIGRCFFLPSRAQREWRRLRKMHRMGIQSTRALARGERRALGFLTDCYLVTEGVPASDSLRDFALRYFHKSASPRGREIKRQLMDQLADHVREMHGKRFFHRELTWDNILIRQTPGGQFEFFFINALRGRRVIAPWKQRRRRARDLAGIDAVPDELLTTADKIRFLKRYLGRDTLTDSDRAWMRQILHYANQIFAPMSTYRSARGIAGTKRTQAPTRQVHTGVQA
jgi:hypothetical protein